MYFGHIEQVYEHFYERISAQLLRTHLSLRSAPDAALRDLLCFRVRKDVRISVRKGVRRVFVQSDVYTPKIFCVLIYTYTTCIQIYII